MRLLNKDEKYQPLLKGALESIHSYWLPFGFLVYTCGFFIWNIYLSSFGFFEYNLIQIRYLSAGLAFSLPAIFIVGISRFLYRKNIRGNFRFVISGLSILGVIGWGLIFYNVFPWIPQYLGGGKPIPTMLIGNPDQIDFLSNFEIKIAENGGGKRSVQTLPVCLLYQNDKYVLFFNSLISTSTKEHFGFTYRLIALSRDEFLGFQTGVGDYPQVCGLSGITYNGIVQVPFLK